MNIGRHCFEITLLLAGSVGFSAMPALAQVPSVGEGRAVGCSICGHPNTYPYHYKSCKYYGLGLNSSSSGGTNSGASTQQLQAASNLGYAIGQGISQLLFG
ncbi:MAG TPA: hypothetical protein VMC06_06220, partial [Opitutaceae bacterium]|nr:hypothetical protein [Opitutaceae bacterium]